VGGTSLVVYPAAGLLRYFHGQKLALINKTPTDFDVRADLVLRGSIGEALDYAVG
jgi:NAD-dependent deacetylase